MQFSEIARERPKRGVFGIFEGQTDVSGLERLECNKGKLRGLVKWAKMRKSKLWGPKCNFGKFGKGKTDRQLFWPIKP